MSVSNFYPFKFSVKQCMDVINSVKNSFPVTWDGNKQFYRDLFRILSKAKKNNFSFEKTGETEITFTFKEHE